MVAHGAGGVGGETMRPEAFHNEPRYSAILTAGGSAILILVGELAG